MDHDTFFNGEEEESTQQKSDSINVGDAERFASGIAGGFLALSALKRGGVSGILMGLAGGSLLFRAATGHCDLYKALGINTAKKAGSSESLAESAVGGESADEQMHEEVEHSHQNINMKAASAKAQEWLESAGVD